MMKGSTKSKLMIMTPMKIGSSLQGWGGGDDDVVGEGVNVERA